MVNCGRFLRSPVHAVVHQMSSAVQASCFEACSMIKLMLHEFGGKIDKLIQSALSVMSVLWFFSFDRDVCTGFINLAFREIVGVISISKHKSCFRCQRYAKYVTKIKLKRFGNLKIEI